MDSSIVGFSNREPLLRKKTQLVLNLHKTIFMVRFLQFLSNNGTQFQKERMFPGPGGCTWSFCTGIFARYGFCLFIH